MIILIGNQKGGAGKSTLTLLIANYLTIIRQFKVTVLDMDYQQSIASKAEKAKVLENEPLYDVVPADLKHFPAMLKVLQKKPHEIALIDLPGKMDDDGLIPVIAAADLVICPFGYDEFTIDSTLLFAMVVKKLNAQAPLIFVPNRIKLTARYDNRAEIETVVRKFGEITPELPDRIDFQRISTQSTPLALYPVTLPALEFIEQRLPGKETA